MVYRKSVTLKKNKNLNKLILGLVFLGSSLLIIPSLNNVLVSLQEAVIPKPAGSGNQNSLQISTERLSQQDKEPLASLKHSQCTTDSEDFLYSDCTGFFE